MRFIAFLLFLLILPITLFISVLIFFTLRESFIFNQLRVGKNKEEFTIHKFKTMKNGKITSLGRVLRKLGLDEIPQLINVMKNEMSFVGPRPLTQQDIIRLNWELDKYEMRWSVKPGITCLAQLSNVCDAFHSMERDLFYVNNKSVKLDVKIIMQSILVPIKGKRTN